MKSTVDSTIEEQDKKVIMAAYKRLLRTLKPKMDDKDKKNIRMAFELAVEAHKEQRRKSGEPYILHPIEVARICADEIGLGPTAIISALLHDTVEDTPVSLEDIREKFGNRIAMIVDGLTKIERLYDVQIQKEKKFDESPQAHNFRKILGTLAQDVRVVLIKIADRIHNMRTLGSMKKEKQLKIASETAFIYAPLAHRLGLYSIKTEFEDLCMKITEPHQYNLVAEKLQSSEKDRKKYVREFMKPLIGHLDELGVKYRFSGRAKSIFSISNKMKKKKVEFEQIYDLYAVRIIVDVPIKKEKSVCWNIYSIVTDFHRPIPERLKDWVSTPKSNGYESLHTTVVGPKGRFVEVQIRSERMDEIAEKGFAAHWKYKDQLRDSDNVYDKWLQRMRELLESTDGDAIDFLNDFRSNLFSEEVYVFTPNGEMKVFPKGATALDFAFEIHSEVGAQCIGIKVDERQVPFSYHLKNGDRVKVNTSKNQKPNESWLHMVITGKAKNKIRSSLKEDRKKLADLGKEIMTRKFKKLKANFNSENIDKLIKHFGYPNYTDLYFAWYSEEITMDNLKDFRVDGGKLELANTPDKKTSTRPIPGETGSKKNNQVTPKVLINDEPAESLNYSLASCCKPVQGDDIFAYTTTIDGIKIHRTNCPNAENLLSKYGYRVMKASWTASFHNSFVADLVITGIDDIGVVQRLTNILTNRLRVNMRSISMDGKEGYYEGRISVVVNNKDQLNFIIKTLMEDESVSSVTRSD